MPKAIKDVPVAEEDEVVLAIMPESDIPVNNSFVPAIIDSGENGAEIVPPDNHENNVTSLEDELFKFKVQKKLSLINNPRKNAIFDLCSPNFTMKDKLLQFNLTKFLTVIIFLETSKNQRS